MRHYLYFLQMNDSRIYTGVTANIKGREKEHFTGKGGQTTSTFGASKIIYIEEHPNKTSALKRERQLKSWTHAKKNLLWHQEISKDLSNYLVVSRRGEKIGEFTLSLPKGPTRGATS